MYLVRKRKVGPPREWLLAMRREDIPEKFGIPAWGIFFPLPGMNVVLDGQLHQVSEALAHRVCADYGNILGMTFVRHSGKKFRVGTKEVIHIARDQEELSYCNQRVLGRRVKAIPKGMLVCVQCQYNFWRDHGKVAEKQKAVMADSLRGLYFPRGI